MSHLIITAFHIHSYALKAYKMNVDKRHFYDIFHAPSFKKLAHFQAAATARRLCLSKDVTKKGSEENLNSVRSPSDIRESNTRKMPSFYIQLNKFWT